MAALRKIDQIEAIGIEIKLQNGHLHAGPKNRLTDDVRRFISEHRTEIKSELETLVPVNDFCTLVQRFAKRFHLTLSDRSIAAELDKADCELLQSGLTENELNEWAELLAFRLAKEAGIRPDKFTTVASCKNCGPVWLDRDGIHESCFWCWNRAKSLPIPRPEVKCIDCQHFTPNKAAPGGIGHCSKIDIPKPAAYPHAKRHCLQWRGK